jgi:hypothetical protein
MNGFQRARLDRLRADLDQAEAEFDLIIWRRRRLIEDILALAEDEDHQPDDNPFTWLDEDWFGAWTHDG